MKVPTWKIGRKRFDDRGVEQHITDADDLPRCREWRGTWSRERLLINTMGQIDRPRTARKI